MPKGYLRVWVAGSDQSMTETIKEGDVIPMDCVYPVWENPDVQKITVEYFDGSKSEFVKEG